MVNVCSLKVPHNKYGTTLYQNERGENTELEQRLAHKDKASGNGLAEIKFVAGKGKYNVNKREVLQGEKYKAKANEVAIKGSLAGAMHGSRISLIATESGAGVQHDGVILSESDLDIFTDEGKVDLGGQIIAKDKIDLQGETHIGNELKAKTLKLKGKNATLGQAKERETAARSEEHKQTTANDLTPKT